jgi:hypothetical protein
MPTPRKRRVRAACGNILGGEPTAAQIAYSNDWWNTVLTEHSRNYAAERNGGKPFNNGESVLITSANPDYDGLISGGEPGADAAMPAIATITVTNAGEVLADGQISFIATGGHTVTITGHASANAMTTTSGASTDGTFDAGGTVSGDTAGNKAQAVAIATAISLHDDFTATAVDTNVVTIQQDTSGASGNTAITLAQNGSTGNMSASDIDVDGGFKGGADALSAVVPHYWCDTNNAKAAVADAVTAALTTADGVIYDPSGPLSQYVPSLEDVSSGTALYIVIKPDGWNANDYISWELIGDTEASNDKLSMKAINASNVAAALNGILANGTIEAVTDKAGTVAYTGRTDYATANANGIAVVWESDGTGADDSSMKKGWYLRWKHTAV